MNIKLYTSIKNHALTENFMTESKRFTKWQRVVCETIETRRPFDKVTQMSRRSTQANQTLNQSKTDPPKLKCKDSQSQTAN